MAKLILGGPGCGKTTRLLEIMEEHLQVCEPSEIGFLAFTRKAANEAKERAATKFGYSPDDLPFFRTIHSLAFMQLGISRGKVMRPQDYDNLGALLNMQLDQTDGLVPLGKTEDATIVFLEQLARVTDASLERLCQRHFVRYLRAKQYKDTLHEYKIVHGLIDFTDMIIQYRDNFQPVRLYALFVDEAQDLSPLHWILVNMLIPYADNVYFAGDDDQAIFRWAGADVRTFLDLKGEREVLPFSHRLPQSGWQMATWVSRQIKQRFTKQWSGREYKGSVRTVGEIEAVTPDNDDWMYLARNEYLLREVRATLMHKGLPFAYQGKSALSYDHFGAAQSLLDMQRGGTIDAAQLNTLVDNMHTPINKTAIVEEQYTYETYKAMGGPDAAWHHVVKMPRKDARYAERLMLNGYDLNHTPTIKVNTIHSVKGGEADHVVLVPDMSGKSFEAYKGDPIDADDETRVLYVGVSRHRKTLHIVQPRTNKFYHLPSPRQLGIWNSQ